MKWGSSKIEELLKAIYEAVKAKALPLKRIANAKDLYTDIGHNFQQGLYKTFSPKIALEFGKPSEQLLNEIRYNNWIFAGAKTVNYVISTEGLIVKGKEIVPINEYLKNARPLFDEYNDNWLKTEYNTIVNTGQSIVDYQKALSQKHIFPNRRWITNGERTCPICGGLDDICLPVDNAFWRRYIPKRVHYGCLCDAVTEYGDVPVTDISKLNLVPPASPFNNDIFETGMVFGPDHGYFDLPQPYKKYEKINFGLPVPKK